MTNLNPCSTPENNDSNNLDPKYNSCNPEDSLNNVPFLDTEESNSLDAGGKADNCSPFQSGKIIPDLDNVNRGIINRYSGSIRNCDMAVKDLFDDIYLLGVNGQSVKVPLIYAAGEKAVVAALNLPGTGMRKDNTLVTDRITLPIMSIYPTGLSFNDLRYTYEMVYTPIAYASENRKNDTVYNTNRGVPVDREYKLKVWTLYLEDMSQLIEIILNKINKMTYVKIQGVNWEVPVKLTGISDNVTNEDIPDEGTRIIKYEFSMVAETYIAQPIIRNKTVQKVVTDYVDDLPENEVIATSIVEETKQC